MPDPLSRRVRSDQIIIEKSSPALCAVNDDHRIVLGEKNK
jgi:hypothetical protein